MKENSPHTLTNSPAAVWWIAAAAFVFASFCRASLTWDGSYFLLQTLQHGTPFVAAHRWFDWILQEPVALLQPWVHKPAKLAVVHSLMCSLPPLFSLAVCLLMLRGAQSRLRIWPVIGILLVPLPVEIFLITEVTPAIQLAWILFIFAWRGCPPRWFPVVVLAMIAMSGLHPAAAPLFLIAAMMAFAFAVPAEPAGRRRIIACGLFFAAASVAQLARSMLAATPYERASMSPWVWIAELYSGLRFSPFPALVPVLVDLALYAWTLASGNPKARPRKLSILLWCAAFALGGLHAFDYAGWVCAINYRKFVIVVTAPVALVASIDAWKLQRNAASRPDNPGLRIAPIVPAALFALVFCGMAFSWRMLCGSFAGQLAAYPAVVMNFGDLPANERNSALNHWSATSLSLVLQDWEPRKILIWDRSLQLAGNRFCICPAEEFPCEDRRFKLAWIASLAVPPPQEGAPQR